MSRNSTHQIASISDFRAAVRSGPYAWPGGYPVYFIAGDGRALSFATVKANLREVLAAIASGCPADEWCVVGRDINWEDGHLLCEHSGERIPSAYGED